MELSFYRRLLPPTEISGIAALSWSYDSKILAVAACEGNQSGIFLFNVVNGAITSEIRPNHIETFNAVSFFGDTSRRLACADRMGNFQCHDTDNLPGNHKTFIGFRIGCLHAMKDGKTVVASDTLQRIRSYDFETQEDMTIITENSPITYFTLDKSEDHILVTTRSEGLRLWCMKTHALIRTFFGSVHNDYVIMLVSTLNNQLKTISGQHSVEFLEILLLPDQKTSVLSYGIDATRSRSIKFVAILGL
jgi:WD40 repeat protein